MGCSFDEKWQNIMTLNYRIGNTWNYLCQTNSKEISLEKNVYIIEYLFMFNMWKFIEFILTRHYCVIFEYFTNFQDVDIHELYSTEIYLMCDMFVL